MCSLHACHLHMKTCGCALFRIKWQFRIFELGIVCNVHLMLDAGFDFLVPLYKYRFGPPVRYWCMRFEGKQFLQRLGSSSEVLQEYC